MSERWEEMERAAERMQKSYNRNRLNMYTPERIQIERDIRLLKEEARKQRDSYCQWLYTGR